VVSWVRAPLRVDLSAGWTDAAPFTDRHVGSLVNLAIDKFQVYDGKEIKCDQVGGGLGSSGAYNVVRAVLEGLTEKSDILDRAFQLEVQENVCGRQDMAASVYGGLNHLEFYRDEVRFSGISLTKPIVDGLQEMASLVDTGKFGRPKRHLFLFMKYDHIEPILVRLSGIATEMHRALLREDLEMVRILVDETWYWQRRIPTLSTPEIEALIGQADAGKVCGAGGGGCVYLMFSSREKKERFDSEHKTIPFKIWPNGVEWK